MPHLVTPFLEAERWHGDWTVPEAMADIDGYAALVRRAAEGDPDALEGLVGAVQHVAYRLGRTVCGGPGDAEDVMQDALLNTFRYINRIRDPASFRTWLYRTVRNACLMKRRRSAGEPARVLSLDESLPGSHGSMKAIDVVDATRGPEAAALNAALRRRLRKALAALPEGYREIVLLREVEGLSTRQAADMVGTSEANVKTRLHRAHRLLRRQLEDA